MTLPRISHKALWKIFEDAGIDPHWVTGFSYKVGGLMKIEMIALIDKKPYIDKENNSIGSTTVDIPVCNCDCDCATKK
jgi:hypothetical protein